MLHGRRQKLSVDDLNLALKARNQEPLYGFDPTEPLAFRSVPGTGLFYVPSEEVDIETLLQEPLPKSPQPMVLTSHWLAIEGVQPKIPQNPTIPEKNALGEPVAGKTLSSDASPAGQARLQRELAAEDAEIKPAVKHVLSKEQQLYYDTILADLLKGSVGGEYSSGAVAALTALKSDAGLQQLIPYFVQFVSESVPKSLLEGWKLRMAMDMLAALLANEHVFIEPYLHQVMPPILTCVVGKQLGPLNEDMSDQETFDHWALRRQAAELVATIAHRFAHSYTTLIPRITKTLSKAIEQGKPLTSQYGAIFGFTHLGPLVVDAVLLPALEAKYSESLAKFPHDSDTEIGKVKEALCEAAKVWAGRFAHEPEAKARMALLKKQALL
jgi:transcription initiation factor TFIID subunit 6